MESAVHGDAPPANAPVAPNLALLRMGIGLVQGVVLCLLVVIASLKDDYSMLLSSLGMIVLLCPILAISGASALSRRQLLTWVGTAALCIAALAVYDIWRRGEMTGSDSSSFLVAPTLTFFTIVCLFIAHALVLSGVREGRRIASYASYFDIAWKLGVQLAFSGLFVVVSWLVLLLGRVLFSLVNIEEFGQFIHNEWFAMPFTTCAFAGALHLTDVKPAIVHGIRNLLLTMLSWVLPVLVLIVGGFLVSLLFTGLQPLWSTRFAAALLLGVDAALIILINAAWQDGARVTHGTSTVPQVIRFSVRIAALLLVPLTAIAVYALALRVGDHGWSVDRVIAAACMLVAGCYAIGYAKAAFGPGWLDGIARVNIATAFVVLGTILLLFSPVADPARLAVNDQVARLTSGKVTAREFDFKYLEDEGMRFGREALARLEAGNRGADAPVVRERIASVRNGTSSSAPREKLEAVLGPKGIADNLKLWPAGTRLPDGFLATPWKEERRGPSMPDCLIRVAEACDVFLLDMIGDGKPEVLLVEPSVGNSYVAQETAPGTWEIVAQGHLPSEYCEEQRKAMRGGKLRAAPPALAEIDLNGHRFQFHPTQRNSSDCFP